MLARLTSLKSILLAAATLLGAVAPAARAAEPPRLEAMANELLTERARTVLERHLQPKQFQLFVTAEGWNASVTTPKYFPAGSEAVIRRLDPAALRASFQKIRVDVFIASTIPVATRDSLGQLLARSLALKPEAGDAVAFADLKLEEEGPKAEGTAPNAAELAAQREADNLKAEVRDIQGRADQVRRERDTFATELKIAQAEVSRQGREIQTLEAKQIALKELGEKKPDDPKALEKKEAEAPKKPITEVLPPFLYTAALFLLAVALFIGLKAIGGSFRSIGTSLTESFTGVAAAVESLGAKDEKPAAAEENAAAAGDQPPLDPQAAETKLAALRAHLAEARDDDALLLEIDRLAETPATLPLAGAALEWLGEKHGGEIFQRLGAEKQRAILRHLRDGATNAKKTELKVAAAEQLATSSFADRLLASTSPRNPQVSAALVRVNQDLLADVAGRLSPGALGLLLEYMGPRRASQLLQVAKRKNATLFDSILNGLAGEGATDPAFERELVEALEAAAARVSARRLDRLDYLKSLVEIAGDDLSEELVARVGKVDKDLSTQLSQAFVGIPTLFKIRQELRTEILQYLSNRDIAALVVSIEEGRAKELQGWLDERRRGLLEEEVTRMKSRAKQQQKTAFENAKRIVVQRLREMRDAGLFGEDEAAPASQPAAA